MRNSKIILCKGINLDRDYVNVLNYTESQMLTLCESKQIANSNTYSFVDMSKGVIYTGFDYDIALQTNYIAFQNPDYSNKWFFAFVDDVIYKGDKNTEIRFTVDSWSTWFDYWTAKTCYVSREHVNDDTIGLHTVPENIDVGEIISDNKIEIQMGSSVVIGVLSNYRPLLTSYNVFSGVTYFGKIIFGSALFIFRTDELDALKAFIKRASVDGHVDDIQDMFMLPANIFESTSFIETSFESDGNNYQLKQLPNTVNPFVQEISVNKLYTFPNFTPKNNKLKVYPYNYIYATNNVGDSATYKFENFSDNTCNFYNFFTISIGGSGRLVPRNYCGFAENNDESLTLGKLPTCQWSSDSYTNWLTQNAVNLGTSQLKAQYNTVANALSGDIEGTLTTMADYYLDRMNSFYSASLLPQKLGGTNTGDINFSTNNLCYKLVRMHPKIEYMQIIDDFFTRFGYKINRLKVPNITGRRNFNYVEIGQNDEIGVGDVPFKYMQEINNTARKGVTIWHNHENIGNFNVQNDII